MSEEQIKLLLEHQTALNAELNTQMEAEDEELIRDVIEDRAWAEEGAAVVKAARERIALGATAIMSTEPEI